PNEKNVQRAAAAALAKSSGPRSGDALADVIPAPGPAAARPSIYIFDTAGRQEINERLIQELKELKEFLEPQETFIVVGAANWNEVSAHDARKAEQNYYDASPHPRRKQPEANGSDRTFDHKRRADAPRHS